MSSFRWKRQKDGGSSKSSLPISQSLLTTSTMQKKKTKKKDSSQKVLLRFSRILINTIIYHHKCISSDNSEFFFRQNHSFLKTDFPLRHELSANFFLHFHTCQVKNYLRPPLNKNLSIWKVNQCCFQIKVWNNINTLACMWFNGERKNMASG